MIALALMMCLFGPSSLIAIVTWWRQPQLWWASLGILTTEAGLVLYLPIRCAFHTPSSLGFDGFGGGGLDGLGILAEYMMFFVLAVIVHVGLLFSIDMLWIEKIADRKKAVSKTENV